MQRPQEILATGNVSASWPQVSDDPEREAWLLRELANTLAKTVDNNSASLLGQNVGGELKASFTRFEGEPTLQLNLPSDRAWATTTQSANKEGFKTWEADSNLGVIYLGYAPYDEDGPGFFSKLTFWSGEDELPKTAPYSLSQLLTNLSNKRGVKTRFSHVKAAVFNDKVLEDKQGYLLVVQQLPEITLVNIRDVNGERLPDDIAKDFLRLLRKNLI